MFFATVSLENMGERKFSELIFVLEIPFSDQISEKLSYPHFPRFLHLSEIWLKFGTRVTWINIGWYTVEFLKSLNCFSCTEHEHTEKWCRNWRNSIHSVSILDPQIIMKIYQLKLVAIYTVSKISIQIQSPVFLH